MNANDAVPIVTASYGLDEWVPGLRMDLDEKFIDTERSS
jgi:hypothetical protein